MKLLSLALLTASFATLATAAPIAFVPPNDTVGIFTGAGNDGWSIGRGIVFQMTDDETIDSVGVFQNLSGILLNFAFYQTTGVTGNVATGQTLLRSGGATVTTAGLEWVDFSFAPLALTSGNSYHLVFSFDGNSSGNFYYNNNDVTWAQGSFSSLDGTRNGDTSNTVVGAFRVNATGDPAGVPEPSSLGLMLSGLSLLGWYKLGKR
jgi:hypothetical protein